MDAIKRTYKHTLNLQMFAEDPDPKDPPADPPAPKKLELTQDEFDAKIEERLARERKKYADYDDLKSERDRLKSEEDARKAAAMTEQERLQAERDEATRKATEATESATKATTAANQRIIRTEFRLLAKESGIRADALDDAYKLADLTGAAVDEEGNVTGVEDVIKALVAAKPYLAEAPKKEPRQVGGPSGGDPKPDKTKEQLIAEAAEKARRTGKIEDRMAYAALKEELNK
ncbi:scaffolding protein [Paenibacillus sp. LPE1-1-1.1]|uniref:phage scaffolding protein n=1 Tax=Paenibacillus sp. LPE1-1-1.1 TaxID=3135230 RepID=UPI0034263071